MKPRPDERGELGLRTAHWTAIFALLGPGVGAALPMAAMLLAPYAEWSATAVIALVLTLLLVLVFAYLYGIVPAVATGLVMGLAAGRLPSRRARIGASAAAGAAMACAWMLLISRGEGGWGGLALYGGSGALAGLVCGWIASLPADGETPASGSEAGV